MNAVEINGKGDDGNAVQSVAVEEVALDSSGHRLAGRLYRLVGPVRCVIALHSATGVPQGYYEPLARWLAVRRGAAVLTYDYRDFGHSATGSLRRAEASMADWGVLDQSAALDYVCERFPDLSVEVVGHSLGGQYLSFHANASRVERLVAVASGPANWLHHPARFMPQGTPMPVSSITSRSGHPTSA